MGLVTIKNKYNDPQQIIKTVAASGTPEAITDRGTYFSHATFIGLKAERQNNSGIVYLGVTPGNDTQPIGISPRGIFTISAPVGVEFDLGTWYLDVTSANDGILVIYS